jgi:mono/diheme cytochrome c family protein
MAATRTAALAVGLCGLSALTACGPASDPAAEEVAMSAAAGQAFYLEYCAACHGRTGRGDGPAAAGLATRPADLTQLTARNGGTFPVLPVMGRIYGYSQGRGGGGGPMPEFGPLLDGEVMLVDLGDGVLTPTPVRLIALVNHLGTLQPD